MIVDAAWYVDGRRTLETDSIEKLAAERGGTGFGWLGLRMPSDRELDQVRDAFGLPELAIADARNKHDRPKVERHEDCLLTVVPTARYVDELEEVEFGELFLYAGRDYVLSVRYGHAAPLANVRHELESEPERLAHGPGAVLQAALLHVVESYLPVIEGLEHDVREVERDVFSESREQPTKRIYFLIREVLDFLVALEPMSASLKRLMSVECIPWVHPGHRAAVPRRRRRPVGGRRAGPDGAPAAEQRADGQPDRGVDPPERGHPQDLGVGRPARHPDARVGHVRHEPRWHPAGGPLDRLRPGHRRSRCCCAGSCTAASSAPTGSRRVSVRISVARATEIRTKDGVFRCAQSSAGTGTGAAAAAGSGAS